eukprot:9591273-Prorocentrum_lima.AAC.1
MRRCVRIGGLIKASPRERVFGVPDPGSTLDSFLDAENPAGDYLALYDLAYRHWLQMASMAEL